MEIKMDIISELNGKRILIWGYGREGKATEHFLQRCVKPASVDIFEGKKEEIDEDDYDFIIKSPGIVMNEENPKYTSENCREITVNKDVIAANTPDAAIAPL